MKKSKSSKKRKTRKSKSNKGIYGIDAKNDSIIPIKSRSDISTKVKAIKVD